MITSNHDNQRDEGCEDILSGLEKIAQDLDGQVYPGRAWPTIRGRPRRWSAWKMAAMLAAAAAIAAVIVYHAPTAQPPDGPETSESDRPLVAAKTPTWNGNVEPAMPAVLVVEDIESYSLIDLTGTAPLVSFSTKETFSPVCVVPVLPESSPPTMPKDETL